MQVVSGSNYLLSAPIEPARVQSSVHFTALQPADRFQRTPRFAANSDVKIYAEEILRQPQTFYQKPLWETEVHELRTPEGQTVRLRSYMPQDKRPGPVILYIPGLHWPPDGGAPFAEHNVESPFPVFSLDRAYTEKDGYRYNADELIQNMKTAVDYLQKRSGNKVHVVGFSFGALLSTRLAVESPDKIASLTLISPSLFSQEYLENHWSLKRRNPAYPENRAEILKLGSHLPERFSKITVPTALYLGEQEVVNKVFDADLQQSLIERIPASNKQFKIFSGPEEDHRITVPRVQALRDWLLSVDAETRANQSQSR